MTSNLLGNENDFPYMEPWGTPEVTATKSELDEFYGGEPAADIVGRAVETALELEQIDKKLGRTAQPFFDFSRIQHHEKPRTINPRRYRELIAKTPDEYRTATGRIVGASGEELEKLRVIMGESHPDIQMMLYDYSPHAQPTDEFWEALAELRSGRTVGDTTYFPGSGIDGDMWTGIRTANGETLFEGMGTTVEGGQGFGGFGQIEELADGRHRISGFLGVVSAPIPAAIALHRMLDNQQRLLLWFIAGFGVVTMALPVLMNSQPRPESWHGTTLNVFYLLTVPIIIALGKLNHANALRIRTVLFWGYVIGLVGRYGFFIVTLNKYGAGYW